MRMVRRVPTDCSSTALLVRLSSTILSLAPQDGISPASEADVNPVFKHQIRQPSSGWEADDAVHGSSPTMRSSIFAFESCQSD